ncbi:MAG: phage holin family protein [Anaerolineae bacterium]|nr:phage holin family protein [Anaerolineae bacterium]
MRKLILRWIINAVALWAAAELVPGITYEGGWLVLAGVAIIFGLVNALLRPVLKLLTCPLIILTLGLFTLVINALMLWLASAVAGWLGLGFHVADFTAAFLGGVIVSVVSVLLSLLVFDEDRKHARR